MTWNRWLWRLGVCAAAGTLLATLLMQHLPSFTGLAAGSAAGSADREESCLPGRAVPIMDSPHISSAEATATRYNSNPPTSGPHFPFTVTPGIYDTPVPNGLLVHALEHGHVAILYAPATAPADVDRLSSLVRDYSADVILAPYPALSEGVALTAWGRIDTLAGYDRSRITGFVEALRGRYDHDWTRPAACA